MKEKEESVFIIIGVFIVVVGGTKEKEIKCTAKWTTAGDSNRQLTGWQERGRERKRKRERGQERERKRERERERESERERGSGRIHK